MVDQAEPSFGRSAVILLIFFVFLGGAYYAGVKLIGEKRNDPPTSSNGYGNRGINGYNNNIHTTSNCDIVNGSWVYNESYSLYDVASCPFITKKSDCPKDYMKYKWKPSGCELPRFNGLDFLKRFKGKRILFVGDSLMYDQWQSLACMLHTSVPQTNYSLESNRDISSFIFPEYNVSMMYNRNVFLVDLVNETSGVVLTLDSIKNGKQWESNDLLIFNTGYWWQKKGNDQPWNFIRDGNKVYKDMDPLVAFEKGLSTWTRWVQDNVAPNKTKVYYVATSPVHNSDSDRSGQNSSCHKQKTPLKGSIYSGGSSLMQRIVKKVLQNVSKHVVLLDTIELTQQQPSTHGDDSSSRKSCSCIGSFPNTWNQLLYATL